MDLTRVPKTIVIGDDGTILRSWVGAYRVEVKQEVEEYFGVKLPSINEE